MSRVAFFSYARLDNSHSDEKLIRFCELLEREVRSVSGDESFSIFVDHKDSEWGQRWERVIAGGLDECAFLIPVISPRYLKRPECQKEFLQFLEKERRSLNGDYLNGIDGLILPLLYLDIPNEFALAEPRLNNESEIANEARRRQWEDIKHLSLLGGRRETKKTGEILRRIAKRLNCLFHAVEQTIRS